MKNSYILLLAIMVLTLFACNNSDNIQRGVMQEGEHTLVATIQMGDTKNTILDIEKMISNIEVFIFEESRLVDHIEGNSLSFEQLDKTSLLKINIPKDKIEEYENNSFRLIAIANHTSNLSDIKSLEDLQNAYQEDELNMPTSSMSKYLMDGSVETGKIQWQQKELSYHVPTTLTLNRAISKIDFTIERIDAKEDKNNTTVNYILVGNPQVKLINYTTKSTLLSGNPYQLQAKDLIVTDFIEMKATNGGYTLPNTLYSYENDWSIVDSDLFDTDRETVLLVKTTYKAKGADGKYGEEKSYYYNIPINYRFKTAEMSEEEINGLHKVQRNHHYSISSSITILGNEDAGEPMNIDAKFSVKPWEDINIDGNISSANYLVIKETESSMVNTDVKVIDFISNLPINIGHIRVSYTEYDTEGQSKVVILENEDSNTSISIDNINKKVTIKHPIPTNYVPLEIDFIVTQLSGEENPLSENVHITQYPPIYIKGEKSPGYRPNEGDNTDADFRFHSTLGSGNQINDVFYRVTALVPTKIKNKYIKIGDPTDGDGSTKRDAESNQLVSPQFIIATQHGMALPVHQYYNNPNSTTWNSYTSFKRGYGPTSYPKQNPYAENSAVYYGYKSAKDRCDNYFEGEYGMDGIYEEHYVYKGKRTLEYGSRKVQKTFKYKGRWRIPTTTELQYINAIQQDQKSSVKSLLWGKYYWTAELNKVIRFENNEVYNNEDAPDASGLDITRSIRCIFDTWKIKNYEN